MIQIYCLVDPRDNKPFYVGATKVLLKERLSGHISDANFSTSIVKRHPDHQLSPKNQLMIALLADNVRPRIDLIYVCDFNAAEFYEQFFFEMLIAQGFQMTNYQRHINYNKYRHKINPKYFQ